MYQSYTENTRWRSLGKRHKSYHLLCATINSYGLGGRETVRVCFPFRAFQGRNY
jgi:hypothetical protein